MASTRGGTAFDPVVLSNSQPRYLPAGSSDGLRGTLLPCWIEEVSPGETLYQGTETTIAAVCPPSTPAFAPGHTAGTGRAGGAPRGGFEATWRRGDERSGSHG